MSPPLLLPRSYPHPVPPSFLLPPPPTPRSPLFFFRSPIILCDIWLARPDTDCHTESVPAVLFLFVAWYAIMGMFLRNAVPLLLPSPPRPTVFFYTPCSPQPAVQFNCSIRIYPQPPHSSIPCLPLEMFLRTPVFDIRSSPYWFSTRSLSYPCFVTPISSLYLLSIKQKADVVPTRHPPEEPHSTHTGKPNTSVNTTFWPHF